MIPVLIFGAIFYPDRLAGQAEQGEPLVAAVYRYKGDTGLYPESLDDLNPAYIAPIPSGWSYRSAEGRPPALYRHGAFHCSLTYHFARARVDCFPPGIEEGWVLDNEGTARVLHRGEHARKPARWTGEELASRRVAELRRRVDRDHGGGANALPNYRMLAGELVRLGRLDEAKSACRRCIEVMPGERWCRIALADLDLRVGSTAGRDEFAAWVRRKPSFSSYCDLAMLDQEHDREAEAMEAVREATKHPLKGVGDGGFRPDYNAFYAARLAYRNRQYPVAFTVCDRWECFVNERGWGDKGYHALRAATYLAAGDKERAVRHAGLAVREGNGWGGDVQALLRAADAGDTKFIHDPGRGEIRHLLFPAPVE